MRTKKDGTGMHCPACDSFTTCKAIPAETVTNNKSDHSQYQYFCDYDDIHFFQRGRLCLSCGHKFITAEVDMDFLNELAELRNAIDGIKNNAERYFKATASASESLGMLSKSLRVLRAIKIHKGPNV
jgi:hypothetical protein